MSTRVQELQMASRQQLPTSLNTLWTLVAQLHCSILQYCELIPTSPSPLLLPVVHVPLLQSKVCGGGVLLAPLSVLVLEGRDITIKNLRVDGALVVRAVPGARVVIDGLTVSNKGWTWTPLEQVGGPGCGRQGLKSGAGGMRGTVLWVGVVGGCCTSRGPGRSVRVRCGSSGYVTAKTLAKQDFRWDLVSVAILNWT